MREKALRLKRAFYLGVTGGFLGLIIVIVTMSPIGNLIDMKLYSHAMGISGILFSIIALFGCFLLKRQKELTACFLMLISAVGGIVSMSLYYVIPAFLLIIAGILTIMNQNEHAQEIE